GSPEETALGRAAFWSCGARSMLVRDVACALVCASKSRSPMMSRLLPATVARGRGLEKGPVEGQGNHSSLDFAVKDTWRIFRIMAEFVEGFETLANVPRAVAVFGSARSAPGSRDYQNAEAM